jgi:hypothetical protein
MTATAPSARAARATAKAAARAEQLDTLKGLLTAIGGQYMGYVDAAPRLIGAHGTAEAALDAIKASERIRAERAAEEAAEAAKAARVEVKTTAAMVEVAAEAEAQRLAAIETEKAEAARIVGNIKLGRQSEGLTLAQLGAVLCRLQHACRYGILDQKGFYETHAKVLPSEIRAVYDDLKAVYEADGKSAWGSRWQKICRGGFVYACENSLYGKSPAVLAAEAEAAAEAARKKAIEAALAPIGGAEGEGGGAEGEGKVKKTPEERAAALLRSLVKLVKAQEGGKLAELDPELRALVAKAGLDYASLG